MNRKLLIQSVVFVIIALVLVSPALAAAAAPQDAGEKVAGGQNGVIDQIHTIIKNVQKAVNTILTKLAALQTSADSILANLTSLQTDVGTIKTTTSAINEKVNSPPVPIRYEYYTTVMPGRFFDAYDTSIMYWLGFSNGGDSTAEVSYTIYEAANMVSDGPSSSSEMNEIINGNLAINGKSSKTYRYINAQNPSWDISNPNGPLKFPILTIKITSDSSSVAPRLIIVDISGHAIDRYLPGDFQKVEIYS